MICRRRPGIADEVLGARPAGRRRPAPAPSDAPATPNLHDVAEDVAEVESDRLELQLARLDLGEIEDVVDDRQQRVG